MRGGRGIPRDYHDSHFSASQKVYCSGLTPLLDPSAPLLTPLLPELDAKPDTREYFWLGICPKPDYRKAKAVPADDWLACAPALPLPALTQLPVQSPVDQNA